MMYGEDMMMVIMIMIMILLMTEQCFADGHRFPKDDYQNHLGIVIS